MMYTLKTNSSFMDTKIIPEFEYLNWKKTTKYSKWIWQHERTQKELSPMYDYNDYYILGFYSTKEAKAFICHNKIKFNQARYDNWPVKYKTKENWDRLLKKDTWYMANIAPTKCPEFFL